MRILLVSVAFMSLMACSQKTQTLQSAASGPAIIGGKTLSSNDPLSSSVVAVWDEANDFSCTGTLIRENIVLTAAHCILGSASNLKIIFSTDVYSIVDSKDSQVHTKSTRKVLSAKVHESYKAHQNDNLDQDDIALIKFSGSLPSGYKPASLLKDEKQIERGTEVVMAGFGVSSAQIIEIDVESMSKKKIKSEIESGRFACDEELTFCYELNLSGDGILRSAQAKIQGFTLKEFRLDESKGQGTCSGDSGGPVFLYKDQTYLVIGVTSRGSIACDNQGIYTNTLEYLHWIDQTIPAL